ncbi:MAG: DedA family protein [Bacteroidaceae bacterium]|nr:DedA family protein [Bacteroidaceae bacterium]
MVETLIDFLKDYGYWGMALLSFLSGSIIPIASEALLVVLLGVGLNAMWLIVVATVGNTLGGITCFMLGYLTDKQTVKRVFRISDKKMERADSLIQRYGYWAAVLSFMPIIGEAILVALGIMRVDKYKVAIVMAIGKFARYAFVAISYYGISSLLS